MKTDRENKKRALTLRLPEQQSGMVEAALMELKRRGRIETIDVLLSPLFTKITETYLTKRVEELTPDHHLIEIAKEYPEVMRVLSIQAKKLIEAAKAGRPVALRAKRVKEPLGDSDEAHS